MGVEVEGTGGDHNTPAEWTAWERAAGLGGSLYSAIS
jgi:hypothetical protein